MEIRNINQLGFGSIGYIFLALHILAATNIILTSIYPHVKKIQVLKYPRLIHDNIMW